jgi:hypothetical protein
MIFMNVDEINWAFNMFDTTLPTEVGRLGAIRNFWMSNMGLKGTIPTEIGLMTDLGKHNMIWVKSLVQLRFQREEIN